MTDDNYTKMMRATLKQRGLNWRKGDAGEWPTESELAAAATCVKRPGTMKHLGLAMTMRKGGATQRQVAAGTGDTQVNVVREAISAKQVKPVKGVHDQRIGQQKVYAVELIKRAAPKRKRTATPAPKPVAPVQAFTDTPDTDTGQVA